MATSGDPRRDDTVVTGDASGQPQRRRAAVALSYAAQQAQGAPKVVAKGRQATAERILALAREAGVPVTESPELTQALMQVDLEQEIPPALYAAVAEILAWIWRLNQDAGGPRR